jgi:predicted permease
MPQLNNSHPIIGIVLFIALFFMPIFGLLHHSNFKKYGRRTFWSHAHLWLGRVVITLGMINGGMGLRLADRMNMSSRAGIIAYSVVAGIMWLAWVVSSILGERRRRTARAGQPPKYTDHSSREDTALRDVHPENGHYAPK